MSLKKNPKPADIIDVVSKIKTIALACVMAFTSGTVLFVMTVWLLLKGGQDVGAHLKLLSHYFPGYTISWTGSVVGFLYAALVGAIAGALIGTIYNRLVQMRHSI